MLDQTLHSTCKKYWRKTPEQSQWQWTAKRKAAQLWGAFPVNIPTIYYGSPCFFEVFQLFKMEFHVMYFHLIFSVFQHSVFLLLWRISFTFYFFVLISMEHVVKITHDTFRLFLDASSWTPLPGPPSDLACGAAAEVLSVLSYLKPGFAGEVAPRQIEQRRVFELKMCFNWSSACFKPVCSMAVYSLVQTASTIVWKSRTIGSSVLTSWEPITFSKWQLASSKNSINTGSSTMLIFWISINSKRSDSIKTERPLSFPPLLE